MSLKLKIPPPLQGLFWALIMWFIAKNLSGLSYNFPAQKPIGAALIILGITIEFFSAGAFFRQKTTVNPVNIQKASTLVTGGMNRLSRNPMYLGLFTLLSGWAVLLGNPINIAILGAFVLCLNWLQIIPEEQFLSRKFGQDYEDYKSRVRRWI